MKFSDETRKKATLIEGIVKHIHPMLSGLGPEVQSAILADLTATYLAAMPPSVREQFLDMYLELVRALVPVNETMIFGPGGHPAGKETPQ